MMVDSPGIGEKLTTLTVHIIPTLMRFRYHYQVSWGG